MNAKSRDGRTPIQVHILHIYIHRYRYICITHIYIHAFSQLEACACAYVCDKRCGMRMPSASLVLHTRFQSTRDVNMRMRMR